MPFKTIKDEDNSESVLSITPVTFHPKNKKPPNKLIEMMKYKIPFIKDEPGGQKTSTDMKLEELCRFNEKMSLYEVDQALYRMLIDHHMFIASKQQMMYQRAFTVGV